MDLRSITLEPLKGRTVSILGYGNHGRVQALNLRDSGVQVVVGARPGKSADLASHDGFTVCSFKEALVSASLVVFLLPDQTIPKVFEQVFQDLRGRNVYIGFAHGYAYHFGGLSVFQEKFFLAGPKGAGAILRDNFKNGGGLPGAFALSVEDPEMRAVVLAYCKAIGIACSYLKETTFQEETECDLFGEQAVLCGGIFQLMEAAYDTLVRNGHSPEMAFFDCCFESKAILDLWMKYGPREVVDRISPTAFFGGLTRGRRVVTEETKQELEKIFQDIRSGRFSNEWDEEVRAGFPKLAAERKRLSDHALHKVYSELIKS